MDRMTNPVLQQLETKKSALKTAIMFTASPFALMDSSRLFGHIAQSAPSFKTLIGRLSPEAPLTQMVNDMAAGQGIKIEGVCIVDESEGYQNAFISMYDQNTASILFQGNPLQEKNGHAITRGIIGHELGHLHAEGHKDHRTYSAAGIAAGTYRDLAIPTLVLAGLKAEDEGVMEMLSTLPETQTSAVVEQVASTLLTVLPESPLLIGIAGALYGLSVANAHLYRSFRHTMEFIADLRGAEISGIDGALALRQHRLTQTRKETPESGLLSSLSEHWEKACARVENALFPKHYDTHPTNQDRIDLLNKAFPDAAAGKVERDMPAVFRSRRHAAAFNPEHP